jgi:hypothetical protein
LEQLQEAVKRIERFMNSLELKENRAEELYSNN